MNNDLFEAAKEQFSSYPIHRHHIEYISELQDSAKNQPDGGEEDDLYEYMVEQREKGVIDIDEFEDFARHLR